MDKELTKTQIFIEKARKVHGDKYDYNKVEYINNHTKVCIICAKHGEFLMRPNNHLNGQGCPRCGREKCASKHRMKLEDFLKVANEKYSNKYDYSKVEYINCDTPICIICPKHGEFWQTPYQHIHSKYGCQKCSGNATKTTEDFINEARKVHGDKYDYSKTVYKKALSRVKIICHEIDEFGNEHGEFEQIASGHLNGNCCPKCSKVFRYNTITFTEKAKLIHNNKYNYSKVEYKGIFEPVCIICPEHGEFWQTPHNHLNKCGCPKCANEQAGLKCKSNESEFIQKARKVHGDKYDYSKVKYINARTKVCIVCPKHGEFWQTPNKHLGGDNCPKCHESGLEIETRVFLENNNIQYEIEKKFCWLGLQKLDFYLPKYNCAIECQGIQHFIDCPQYFGNSIEDNQNRDKVKKEKCEENGVKIYYFSHHPFNNFLGEIVYHDLNDILNKILL